AQVNSLKVLDPEWPIREAPWRVRGIPAPGGGPVGGPGEWIRLAKSSQAAHRGQAFLRRGIAATCTAEFIGPAPRTGIGKGTGQRHCGQRDCDNNDRSHDRLLGKRTSAKPGAASPQAPRACAPTPDLFLHQ